MNNFRVSKFSVYILHRTFFTSLWRFVSVEPQILKAEDKGRIIDFLVKHYYPYEPLNSCLNSNKTTINELNEFYTERAIADECSLFLLNSDNKIISVLLNKIETRGAFQTWPCKDPISCQISKFYNQLHLESNVPKTFKAETFINIDVMAVDLSYVGKGLSQMMVALTKEIATQRKIKLISFICTSNYTARSAARAGFISVFSMNYADYKVDDKQVFNPKLPHTEVHVFVLSVPLL